MSTATPEQASAWAAKARAAIADAPRPRQIPEPSPAQRSKPPKEIEPSEALSNLLDALRAFRRASGTLEAALIEALPALMKEAEGHSLPDTAGKEGEA